MFVAFVIQHVTRMHRVVIYGLYGCTIFFPHYLINGTIFEKKSYCVFACFHYKFSLKYFSFKEEIGDALL